MAGQAWEQLNDTYREHGLVLALGAGLSIGCHIPNWEELLARLASRCLGPGGADICTKLFDSGYSFPAITSILKANCDQADKFADFVREELYRDFPFFPDGVERRREEFIRFVQQNSPTLRAIATFCACRDERGFARNRRVHAIINFNLDCVLRAYDEVRFNGSLYRTVERASAGTLPHRINIYQAHGYLVFNREQFGDASTETTKLTITEHEYYDFFNDLTGLFNYTFLFLLREYSCLFLGMSMRDDNVRRLLHYSTKERVQSGIDEGRTREEAVERSIRHFAVMRRSNDDVDKLTEGSLESLGARPLWIDDYAEIPHRLADLYRAGEGSWDDVW